jgi:hypothetical protein
MTPAWLFPCSVTKIVYTIVPYSDTYAYNLASVPSICSLLNLVLVHRRGHDNLLNRVDSADSGGIGIRYISNIQLLYEYGDYLS